MKRALALFSLLCTLAAPGVGSAADVPAVAAAADLAFALPEIAAAFKRDTGREVKLSFGSSGNFSRQIAEGAPFELFLSADERYVEQIRTRGRADGAGVLYGVGRIVQFVPKGSPVKADPKLQDLAAAAASPPRSSSFRANATGRRTMRTTPAPSSTRRPRATAIC